jgi:GMP synthase (glutamine-hydrolysing)
VVDNLSPYTPDIRECLDGLGIGHLYRKYSEVAQEDLEGCDKVILSGRRKNSKEINAANSRIVRYCHENEKPLLGICYGAEIIALTLGGSLRKMPSHVQGHFTLAVRERSDLTGESRELRVYESHRYCVARLPAHFRSQASSEDCAHELFSHESKKIFGTQFHPEKSGPDGIAVLKAFSTL